MPSPVTNPATAIPTHPPSLSPPLLTSLPPSTAAIFTTVSPRNYGPNLNSPTAEKEPDIVIDASAQAAIAWLFNFDSKKRKEVSCGVSSLTCKQCGWKKGTRGRIKRQTKG